MASIPDALWDMRKLSIVSIHVSIPLTTPVMRKQKVFFFFSFCYAITPAHGNWFQTNQPDHESDDRACNLLNINSVCDTNEKDTALQQQI